MTLFWAAKRGKKSAKPNLVNTTTMVSKFWALHTIETMPNKNEKIIYLYIDA